MNVTTSATLIQRIHLLEDKLAWNQFYDLYAPLVKNYALRRGCTQIMSDDIVQLTFVSLMKSLPRFEFKPEKGRFRAFLYTLVRRRIADVFENQSKLSQSGSNTQYERTINEFEDATIDPPGKAWDDLWDKNLLGKAFEQVKHNICEKGDQMTIDIFDLYVFQRFSASAVREKIQDKYGIEIKENKIYQDKSRVIELWKSEVTKLKDELGE